MRFRYLLKIHSLMGLMLAALALPPCGPAWAVFGEDIEAPKPKFSQEGGDWIATLIPRGKSSEIKIRIHVTGGTLTAATAQVFAADHMPRVDKKNFRSDFFAIQVTPSTPGGEVTLAMHSKYFTTATELWGPVSANSPVWQTTGAVNVKSSDRSSTLTLTVRDGGPLDADGQADGRVQVICGPRDSFWGYALGTLFIRFFGVFIVLAVLEVGMLISGRIFQNIEKRTRRPAPLVPAVETIAPEVDPMFETAAVIALALHLDSQSRRASTPADQGPRGLSAWSHSGRARIMADRMPIFDRMKRK